MKNFKERGYEFNFLYKILKNVVSNLNRNDLIKYKDKIKIENKFLLEYV